MTRARRNACSCTLRFPPPRWPNGDGAPYVRLEHARDEGAVMRLEVIAEDRMTPRQRELADRITARRGAGRGPYRVWLRSPEVCERVEALGAFARFESALPEHLRLLTLLVAGRVYDAQYSWNAH